MGDHAVMRVDADQDRQRHAVLDHEIDAALHELVEIALQRRKHPLDIAARKFLQSDSDHHQHDTGRRQPIEFKGCIVDHGARLQTAQLELGDEALEHTISRPVIDDGRLSSLS